MKQDLYTIQEVSSILGVSPKTLRRWEETGKIKPIRTIGNQRRYRLDDVKKLERRINLQKARLEARREIAEETVSTIAASETVNPSTEGNNTQVREPVSPETSSLKIGPPVLQEFPVTSPPDPVIPQTVPQIIHPIQMHTSAPLKQEPVQEREKPFQKNQKEPRRNFKPFISGFAAFVLLLVAALVWQQTGEPGVHPGVKGASTLHTSSGGKTVLGASDAQPAFQLNINIPTFFGKKVTFLDSVDIKKALTVSGIAQLNGGIKTNNTDINAGSGKLTASNVLYSIKAGSNIIITGDKQNPTISAGNTLTAGTGLSIAGNVISNSDTGTAQNIFKTFTIGSTNITAGSNNDTLTFAAGSGISISGDSGSKTITIASSSNSTAADLWQLSGGAISPLDSTNDLLLGGTTIATSKFAFTGNSSGIPTMTIAAATGGDSTSLTGTGVLSSTNNLSLTTGETATSSGTITIQSGNSSVASAGNVNIDTGGNTINGVTVTDLSFENVSDINELLPHYAGYYTLTQDCTVSHSGNCSLNMTGYGTGGGNDVYTEQGSVYYTTLVPGHKYVFSMYVKAATTPAPIFGNFYGLTSCFSYGIQDNTTTWTHITWTCTAQSGQTAGEFQFGFGSAATETHYFDDLTATDVTASSTTSELNLGATNAQEVTLGNSNELGATNIYGGSGINLNSGINNITLNGNAIGVGTTNPTAKLSVVGATSDNTTNALIVTNNGGTSLLKLADDGTTTLGTGAGTSFGNTNVGTYQWAGAGTNQMVAQKVTTTGGGAIGFMSAYVTNIAAAPYNKFQFAIYSDNAGTPGNYIASSSIGTLTTSGQWYTLPITATLAPSTTYWLVYWQNDNIFDSSNGLNYLLGIPGTKTEQNTYTWQSGTNNGWPTAFPTSGMITQTGVDLDLYASYTTSGPAFTINPDGQLTLNGPALFQDPTNSNTAFAVENALGSATPFAVDTNNNQVNVGGNLFVTGSEGIGTTTPLATLDIRGSSGTIPIASLSGNTSSAGLIVDNSGSGDIFSASSSGVPHFTIQNDGTIVSSKYTQNNGLIYTNGSGVFQQIAPGINGSCLIMSGGAIGWGTCQQANLLQENAGALAPTNISDDFLLGGTATASARFAFINNTGADTPTASISANNGGGATYLTGDGSLATVNKQSLTLGSASTGTIGLYGFGAGVLHSNAAGILSSANVNLTSEVSGILPVANGGTGADLTTGGENANGSIPYFSGGVMTTLGIGGNGTCLVSNGGAPVWSGCSGTGGSNFFQESAGAIAPMDVNNDFLLGANATNSAKFAFTGNAGTFIPVASIAATPSSGGTNGLALSGNGSIGSLNGNSLTIGGATTGDIQFKPGNSGSSLYLASNGNVGIGTTTPLGTLNLNVGGTASADTFVIGNTTTKGLSFMDTGTAVDVRSNGVALDINNQTNSLNTNINTGTGNVGIGTNAPQVKLDVRGNVSGTHATASISGQTSFSTLVVDQSGVGDIFTASKSGATKLVLNNNGNLYLAGNQTIDTLINGTLGIGTDNATTLTLGRIGQGITLPGFSNCGALTTATGGGLQCSATPTGTNFWDSFNGVLTPKIETQDLLLGGIATTSAKFAVTGIDTNTPVASLSGVTGGAYLSAAGNLATTNRLTLALGGGDTGNLSLQDERLLSPVLLTQTATGLDTGLGTNGIIDAINKTYEAVGGTGTGGVWTLNGNVIYPSTIADQVGIGTSAVGNGQLVINQPNASGDIFSASQSGNTKFTISNSGNVTLANYTNCGSLTTDTNGLLTCSGVPTGINFWNETLGALSPQRVTDDLILGGSSSSSAKFAFTNNAGGTPTASISANSGNNALYLTGSGTIQTTNAQSLLLNPNGYGNVGIGTSNPDAPLTLMAPSGTNVLSVETPTNSASDTSAIQFNYRAVMGYDGDHYDAFIQGGVGKGVEIEVNQEVTNVPFMIDQYHNIMLGDSAVAAERTNGIYPSALLTVGGSASVSSSFTFDSANLPQIQSTSNQTLTLGGTTTGDIAFRPGGQATGNSLYLASNSNVGIGTSSPHTQLEVNGAIRLSGTTTDNFTTPQGSSVGTKINIPLYDPGAFGQILALGLPSGANSSARVISIFDNRTGSNNQPPLDIVSPNETAGLGLAWEGQNNVGYFTASPGIDLGIESGSTVITNFKSNGLVGIGTNNPLSTLDVRADTTGGNALPVASLSGQTTAASLIVDQSGLGDIFTASKSGATKFTILNNGDISLANYSNCGSLTTIGTTLTCSGVPTGTNFWNETLGSLSPQRITDDLLLGGSSTSSAKFAFIGNAGNATPVASISAQGGIAPNGLALSPGQIQSLNNGSLTIGGNTTGNIYLQVGTNQVMDMTNRTIGINFNNGNSTTIGGATGFGGVESSLGVWGPVTFSRNTNSATGFVVNNAAGNSLFTVGTTATNPVATIAANTTFAGMVVDQSGLGDIFTASKSGATKFTILNNGNIQFGNYKTGNGLLYTDSNGVLQQTVAATGGATNCLSAAFSWVTCGGTGTNNNYLQLNSTVLSQANTTEDLVLGGTSTASAKFAFIGNAGNATPVASISAQGGIAPNGLALSPGTIQSLNNGTLTIGGTSTGDIAFQPGGQAVGNSLYLASSGNIGIGTNVPKYAALSVKANTSYSNLTSYAFSAVDSVTDNRRLSFGYDSSLNEGVIQAVNVGTSFNNLLLEPNGGDIGVGTANPIATLDVRGDVGTIPVASFSGATTNATEIVDQSGTGDIFTASKSGATKFALLSSGNLQLANYSSCGSLTTDASGDVLCGSASGQKLLETYTISVPTGVNLHAVFTGSNNSAVSSSSGTLTFPSNTAAIEVKLKAGGGGGGGVGNVVSAGSGGGEGGYSQKYIANLGTDYYIKVGGGGAGGSTSGGSGAQGTDTCISTNASNACSSPLASATGGSGGTGTSGLGFGGAGGVGANGDLNLTGQAGFPPGNTSSIGGNGGGIGGGLGVTSGTGGAGSNGGGGGSSNDTTGASSYAGGKGGDGYMIITVYTASNPAANYWQLNNNVLAPATLTNTLTIGGPTATSSLATADIRNLNGTEATASISGATSFAGLIVDNSGVGDIFTASKSGASKFTILNNGDIQANNYNTNLGLLYTNGNGLFQQLTPGSANQCLSMNSGANGFTWGDCGGAGSTNNYWQLNSGAISPFSSTADLLLGGTATNSADFAFTGVDSATPVASISAFTNSGDKNGISLDASTSTIQSLNRNTLTLGGSSTGDISFRPGGVTAGNSLYLASNGSVGIGTTTPGELLDLYSTGTYGTAAQIETPGTGSSQQSYLSFVTKADNNQLGTATNLGWQIGARGNAFAGNADNFFLSYWNGTSWGSGGFEITPTGNIGVGTGSPQATLDIRGTLATQPVASFSGSSNFANLVVDQSGAGDIFAASASGYQEFKIDNAGNVGIGNFAAKDNIGADLTSANNGNAAQGLEIVPGNNVSAMLGLMTTGNYESNISFGNNGTYTNAASITFNSNFNNDLSFWTNNTAERMDLLQNGQLGINTTSPNALLDINGANGTNPITGLATLPTASISAKSTFAAAVVDQSGTGDIFTASKSGATRFVVSGSGNVGIGNYAPTLVNPQHTLDLSKTAGSENGIVFWINGTTQGELGFAGNTGQIINQAVSGDLGIKAIGQTSNILFSTGLNSNEVARFDSRGDLAIGTNFNNSPANATLDVRNATNTTTASISGATVSTALVVDQSGTGDIFTASKSGATKFTVKNSGVVIIGNNTNGIQFDPTFSSDCNGQSFAGIYCGSARPTKQIVLSPEYAGAVLTASGSASTVTNGFMTSDASPSASSSQYNFENYYDWTSTQNALQHYTVAVRVTLPKDFSAWASNAITADVYTNLKNNGSNKVDILAYKTSDGSVVLYDQGISDASGGGGDKTWITRTYTSSQVKALSPGDTIVFYITLYSMNNQDAMVGDIKLNYLSAF